MKFICSLLLVCLTTLLFSGCERDIDLPLRQASDALVVEATIENGKPPIVFLSTSYNYFSKITPALLAASFVHGARIVIKSGIDSAVLREYNYAVGTSSIYFYTLDTARGARLLLGQLLKSYTMTIAAGGKSYSSQTTIPALTKTSDSLWARQAPNNPDTLKRILFARVTDPPGLGNYIRYFTSVNDSAYLPGSTSVYDDDFVDGTTYSTQVFRGIDRSQEIDVNEFGYFKKGDTVSIKLCNIDQDTYTFWRTLETNQQSVGNPFSQPGVVLGNISGGALGCFSGYAAQYKQIIISK